jgi:hypothetical protein
MIHRDPSKRSFADTITDAVRDFATFGYDSEERLRFWLDAIREAAEHELVPRAHLEAELRRSLGDVFDRLVARAGVLATMPGVPRFTLSRVQPQLRDELNRRVLASANLIVLNRDEAIAGTLRRFSGWASSVPSGGDEEIRRNPVKSHIRKSLASLPFEERRCAIDQGIKLERAIGEIVARGGGAIAVKWNHIVPRPSYQSRPEHLAMDGKVYALRNNWALERGLMKAGPDGYYEDTDGFGTLVYCSCWGTYLFSLGQLPDDMLTNKGCEELESARRAVA